MEKIPTTLENKITINQFPTGDSFFFLYGEETISREGRKNV